MAIRVGWSGAAVPSKGSFYSRYKNRFSRKIDKSNIEYVNKHDGEVFTNVVWNPATKSWQGVGRPIAVEPKYANLSGSDRKIKYTPRLPVIKIRRIEVPHRAPIIFGKPTRVL